MDGCAKLSAFTKMALWSDPVELCNTVHFPEQYRPRKKSGKVEFLHVAVAGKFIEDLAPPRAKETKFSVSLLSLP